MSPTSIDSALRRVSELLNSGQVQVATQQLDSLIAQHPGTDALLYPRMLVHAQAGEADDAFDVALQLSPSFKQQQRVSFQILQIARSLTRIKFDQATESEICRLLVFQGLDCTPISEAIVKLFLARAQAAADSPDILIAAGESPIIDAALTHFWLTDPDIELVVTRWRRLLLKRCVTDIDAFAASRKIAAAIGQQGHRNEYAFFVAPDEAGQLDQLTAALTAGQFGPAATASAVLALLMYHSPTELQEALGPEALANEALQPDVREAVARDLDQTRMLRRYAGEFSGRSDYANETTRTVAEMYAENPYPRWVTAEANTNFSNLPYPQFYGLPESPAWLAPPDLAFESMLVAGCGTGWHPISHAITFPWIQITAIDISATSLGYARLMAEKLGVRNIRFERADLLELDERIGLFDVIESVGTLHHLKAPELGLRRLIRHLRPGGIFRLGLYSRLARRDIIRFRAANPVGDEAVDAAFVRRIRQRIHTDPEYASYRNIMQFGDFFSISGCRDLILHPQESQYSVPELVALLEANGLEFLTFSPDDIVRFQMLDGQGSPYELVNWQAVEEKEPRLFNNMYQFFTQKRG